MLYTLLLASGGAASAAWASSFFPGTLLDFGTMTGLAVAFLAVRAPAIRLPRGDEVRITLVVGVVGLSLSGAVEVLLASLLAAAADALVLKARERAEVRITQLLDAIRSSSILALLMPWQILLRPMMIDLGDSDAVLFMAMLAGLAYAFLDIATLAMQQWIAGGMSAPQGVRSLTRPLAAVYMVHAAMAAVALRAYSSLGSWGLAIVLLLTLILQNSFNLYLRIRRAYAQTIRVLAHAAELDRPQDAGHAERVSDLSVAVGRLHGLSSAELESVGYAALLHDIGRIGCVGRVASDSHPARGAEIVDAVPFLDGVAPIIRHHRESDGQSIPEGAAIVGICCRYDRLCAEMGAVAALEHLSIAEEGHRLRAVQNLTAVVLGRPASAAASNGCP